MYALAPDTLIYLDSDGKRLTDKDASSYNLLRLDSATAMLLK
jgi:hypothetical protein